MEEKRAPVKNEGWIKSRPGGKGLWRKNGPGESSACTRERKEKK